MGVAPPKGIGVRIGLLLATLLLPGPAASLSGQHRQSVLVVVGAPGEEEYASQFQSWTDRWREAAAQAGADFGTIGLGPTNTAPDHDLLERKLAELNVDSKDPAWLVFVGHGTYSGEEAKFNLRGPDVSDLELATWLQPFRRPLAVIQCASASGPFLAALSHTNRVVIVATQSGSEQNFARFGQYLAQSIADATADLDKDGQTSLLESFLVAARGVADFYEGAGRLATEHALLDDNGDRLGTPADWFEGVRAVKKAAGGATPDGRRAHQFHLVRSEAEQSLPESFRLSRDQLELELESLRDRKSELQLDVYYEQLEQVLVRLARLYDSSGQLSNPPTAPE